MFTNILDGIGKTPLLKLGAINPHACDIWVKLENRNSGGSIKDRVALYMVDMALKSGALRPDGVLIEPTSGNTGIALAMVAAVRNMRCILTMPESMSLERRKLLTAMGAELVLTPATEGMQGAVREAEVLTAKIQGAFMPNQFSNPHVIEAHYMHTGPEILADIQAHALVAGVGTGGTLTGTGLFLREHIKDMQIHAVEPAASPLLSAGKVGAHGIQGIGPNFIPSILRQDIIDKVWAVHDDDALETARLLFRKEGINGGISSGANVWAALQLASQSHMAGKNIVTFICDTGERYMSTPLFIAK